MNQHSKKEIRRQVEEIFNKGLDQLNITKSSKKLKRLVARAARRIARQLKSELKKKSKKGNNAKTTQA